MTQTDQLSEREKEVVGFLLQGKSNKQIALALGISERTVEFHLKNVYGKLQVNSRTEAVLKLGKTTGGEPGESPVNEGSEKADNGGKPIPLWRQKMSKRLLASAIVAIAGITILTGIFFIKTPRQTGTEQVVKPTSAATETVAFIRPIGKILYSTSQNDFYIADADGTGSQLVMANVDAPHDISYGPHIANAVLSPDAKQIVYVSDGFIYLKNIETGQQQKLNNDRMGGEYSVMQWSPDGNRIGFDCVPGATSEICVLNIQTGNIDILTNASQTGAKGSDGFYFSGWSQDGSKIGMCLQVAPEHSGRPHTSIYWLNTQVNKVNLVLDENNLNGSSLGCPKLSPDGKKMLFPVFPPDKTTHLYSIDIDGKNLQEIALPNTNDTQANLQSPVIFNPEGTNYYASYCSTQLHVGICTPMVLTNDGNLLFQSNLTGATIRSWVPSTNDGETSSTPATPSPVISPKTHIMEQIRQIVAEYEQNVQAEKKNGKVEFSKDPKTGEEIFRFKDESYNRISELNQKMWEKINQLNQLYTQVYRDELKPTPYPTQATAEQNQAYYETLLSQGQDYCLWDFANKGLTSIPVYNPDEGKDIPMMSGDDFARCEVWGQMVNEFRYAPSLARVNQSADIATIRQITGKPDLALTFQTITDMANAAGRDTALYKDETGTKYYVDVQTARLAQIDPNFPSHPDIPASETKSLDELRGIASQFALTNSPRLAELKPVLIYEENGKANIFFFTWTYRSKDWSGTDWAMMPPFIQIGVLSDGQIATYINTLDLFQ